jgi:hypothetical protein
MLRPRRYDGVAMTGRAIAHERRIAH